MNGFGNQFENWVTRIAQTRRKLSLAEIGGFWRAMGLVERMGDINLANVSFIQ